MSTLHTPRRLTIGLAVATVVAFGALAARVVWAGTPRYGFLAWNLILAWVPYLAAVAATALARTGRRGVLPLGVLWLLFWPNAPYIVTDVVHLLRPGAAITWVEVTLVALFAATGLALGLASLGLIHRVVAARRGRAAGLALVAVALPLGAFGIYLGRVHRFNSWDVVADPLGILRTLAFDLPGPLSLPAMAALLAAMTGCLGLAYAVAWRLGRATNGAGRISWRGPESRWRRHR